MKLDSLLSARCRHRSMKSSSMEGHTSLSTALVGVCPLSSYLVILSTNSILLSVFLLLKNILT